MSGYQGTDNPYEEAIVAKAMRQSRRPSRPTSDEVIARAKVQYALIIVLGIFVGFLSFGTATLMMVPLARAIAGTHTEFAFSLSLSISATLAVSTAIAGGWGVIQARRAKRYRQRNLELEKRLGFTPSGEVNEAGADVKLQRTDRRLEPRGGSSRRPCIV